MRIPTKTVKEVVTEASSKMADPNYSAVIVGGFVQQQTATAQYIGAHEAELGGPEAVVNAIFHASLIALCFQRANNRSVRAMSFDDLNHVAGDDSAGRLEVVQPEIVAYIQTNVELDVMKNVLYLIALAMEWVS